MRYRLAYIVPMRFETTFYGHQGDWFRISWWQWNWTKRIWRGRILERRVQP